MRLSFNHHSTIEQAKMYLVTYDLHKPEKEYKPLIDALESYPDRLHVLASTWLLSTTGTAQQISDRLRPLMDRDDHILIIKVSNDYQGWLPDASNKWINSHF